MPTLTPRRPSGGEGVRLAPAHAKGLESPTKTQTRWPLSDNVCTRRRPCLASSFPRMQATAIAVGPSRCGHAHLHRAYASARWRPLRRSSPHRRRAAPLRPPRRRTPRSAAADLAASLLADRRTRAGYPAHTSSAGLSHLRRPDQRRPRPRHPRRDRRVATSNSRYRSASRPQRRCRPSPSALRRLSPPPKWFGPSSPCSDFVAGSLGSVPRGLTPPRRTILFPSQLTRH